MVIMSNRTDVLEYEWMIKYTPQEAWIKGKGAFLWLAFLLTEICAGAYLVSLFLKYQAGMIVGWLGALILGGLFHMLYLGKATRGWRILLKVSTSELSRGLWLIIFFGIVGFLQILPIVFSSLPWTAQSTMPTVFMGIICVLVIPHGFMTMGVVKALPMWNSPMMIPLSLASGIWVGSQIVILLMILGGTNALVAEDWARWSLFFYMGALLIFLWGGAHSSDTTKASIKRILAGDSSVLFYLGVLVVGIVIPLIITIVLWGNSSSNPGGGFLVLRFLCVFVGDALMRFYLMKSPLYSPLI